MSDDLELPIGTLVEVVTTRWGAHQQGCVGVIVENNWGGLAFKVDFEKDKRCHNKQCLRYNSYSLEDLRPIESNPKPFSDEEYDTIFV